MKGAVMLNNIYKHLESLISCNIFDILTVIKVSRIKGFCCNMLTAVCTTTDIKQIHHSRSSEEFQCNLL